MKKADLKGFLISVKTGEPLATDVTVGHDLKNFYELLECDLFDVVRCEIGGERYDIYVDDEGLLKDEPFPVASCQNVDDYVLFGNALIFRSDDMGETVSLTDDDVKNINNHVKVAFIDAHGEQRVLPHLVFKL